MQAPEQMIQQGYAYVEKFTETFVGQVTVGVTVLVIGLSLSYLVNKVRRKFKK